MQMIMSVCSQDNRNAKRLRIKIWESSRIDHKYFLPTRENVFYEIEHVPVAKREGVVRFLSKSIYCLLKMDLCSGSKEGSSG